MKALEDLKAIIANAPDGASHYSVSEQTYYKFKCECWMWCSKGKSLFSFVQDDEVCNDLRSLSDIERIIELMEDESRLDHLQKCNEIFNARAGSNYGWKVDWNHNRIAIVDIGVRGVTIRMAIDDHIKKVGDL